MAVLSILLCLTGCASDRAILGAAYADKAKAGTTGAAIEAGREIPDIPADCRRQEASGIALGDRLDVAVVKSDRARQRANARVTRCAQWHDEYRAGRMSP